MRGVILAAGRGTRLSSLRLGVPKPMAPLLGKPLIEHTIGLLKKHGVDELYINVHEQGDTIAIHLGTGGGLGVRIHYQFEPQLSGTAGPLRFWRRELSEGAFVVVYGDVLTDVDISALVDAHRAQGAVATIAVKQDEMPERCGVVSFDADGLITRFQEKPQASEIFTNWTNAGVYVLEPEVLNLIDEEGEVDFGRDVLPALLRSGARLCAYPIRSYLMDVGEPDRYKAAQDDLQAGRCLTYASR